MTVQVLPVVFAGADTHADTVHVAVISEHAVPIADKEFATTATGYAQAVSFVAAAGVVAAFGIEGTSSYGAGLARSAAAAGMAVIEVNHPEPADRRRQGKSDPLDAYAAADAMLASRARALPKGSDGITASIRAVHLTAVHLTQARCRESPHRLHQRAAELADHRTREAARAGGHLRRGTDHPRRAAAQRRRCHRPDPRAPSSLCRAWPAATKP